MEPVQSVNKINQFVKNITKNNIEEILQVDPDTRAIQVAIINAVYFKGDWVFEVLIVVCEIFVINWITFNSRCQNSKKVIPIEQNSIGMV